MAKGLELVEDKNIKGLKFSKEGDPISQRIQRDKTREEHRDKKGDEKPKSEIARKKKQRTYKIMPILKVVGNKIKEF